jgi:hypothetical protein
MAAFTLGNATLQPCNLFDLGEKIVQSNLSCRVHIRIGIAEEFKKATEKIRQVGYELQIGDRVEEGDPWDQKYSRKGVDYCNAIFEQRYEATEGESGVGVDWSYGYFLWGRGIGDLLSVEDGDVGCSGFRYDILDQTIEQLGAILDGKFGVGCELVIPSAFSHAEGDLLSYFAQGIEHLVEVEQDLALCDLGNVVHALARIISNSSILIGKAGEDGRDDFF